MRHFWSNNYIKNESNGGRSKTLSVEEYLNKIRPYLKDLINNLKTSYTLEIQLTTGNNFISSIANNEEPVMDSKSDNIEIIINGEADEVIRELFDLLKTRYKKNLKSMKGSDFLFDYVHFRYYKCHNIKPNCSGLYKDSPNWIKNVNATINPIKKKDNKCFQYAVTIPLNHEEVRK